MARTLELDWETKSDLDLLKVGLDVYARHPSTRVLMGCYSLDEGPWKHWQAHLEPIPQELVDALEDTHCEKWAFNAQFERVIAKLVLKLNVAVKGWRCTMALAYLQSFQGGLEDVGAQIGLAEDKQKEREGKRLVRMFTQPQRVTRSQPHVWRDWETDPLDWEAFCAYNIQDCVAERAVRKRLWKWRPPAIEWQLYELDQIINDRGKPIDREFINSAIALYEKRLAALTALMIEKTGLANPGSQKQLMPWLRDRGYPFRDMQKATVAKALAYHEAGTRRTMTPECVEVLKLRQWQSRTSPKKYYNMLERAGDRSVLCFMLQFVGAQRTARWSGRGPQPQNLPSTPPHLEDPEVLALVNDMIRRQDMAALGLLAPEPMEIVVGTLRSAFVAPSDYEFVCADLSSIESAVVAWLARCKRLLEVFRNKKDPYRYFATIFYKILYDEVTGKQRKFCKPPMLGCAYRLGGGGLSPDGQRTGLWGYSENMGVDMPLQESFRAVKVFREEFPEIPQFWKDLEKAAERAIDRKSISKVGPLEFEYDAPYLKLRLPTNRCIHYYQPRLRWETITTDKRVKKRVPAGMDYADAMFQFGVAPGEEYEAFETYEKRSLSYMGAHQKTGQWTRIPTHGGRTTEQATQATAREVLTRGMIRVHEDGFRVVSHVHDELIALQKKGDNYFTLDRMTEHMIAPIPEMPGLPLGASGWHGEFYRKD